MIVFKVLHIIFSSLLLFIQVINIFSQVIHLSFFIIHTFSSFTLIFLIIIEKSFLYFHIILFYFSFIPIVVLIHKFKFILFSLSFKFLIIYFLALKVNCCFQPIFLPFKDRSILNLMINYHFIIFLFFKSIFIEIIWHLK